MVKQVSIHDNRTPTDDQQATSDILQPIKKPTRREQTLHSCFHLLINSYANLQLTIRLIKY